MPKFEELYHKILTDPHFRMELRAQPEQALKSIGIDPTPEILAALKAVESAILTLEQDIDGTPETACVT